MLTFYFDSLLRRHKTIMKVLVTCDTLRSPIRGSDCSKWRWATADTGGESETDIHTPFFLSFFLSFFLMSNSSPFLSAAPTHSVTYQYRHLVSDFLYPKTLHLIILLFLYLCRLYGGAQYHRAIREFTVSPATTS